MRRTFTYSLPESFPVLAQGQRLLVPFGQSRKIGFYLGASTPEPGIQLKHVIRELDADTFFPPDLFSFCLWMSEYYFANPADCLVAALPPHLKSAQPARYRWSEQVQELLLSGIRSVGRPGSLISGPALQKIRASRPNAVRDLIRRGEVIEDWEPASTPKSRIIGYRVTTDQGWDDLFRKIKTKPRPFDGVRSRPELIDSGWTLHALSKAVKHNLIQVVHQETGGVLDFIKGKAEVASIQLTDEQRSAFETIRGRLSAGFHPFLLHGVTGSGKTIVYCHLTKEVIASRQSALILTPEIALSGATLAYFRGFFGDTVTVIHSAMTDRERLESWQGIRSGKFKIVVGPRSAIFAPISDLGLIVVDEEHDGSYKQDEPSPRFHGRDCAIMRAKLNNVPVLLGSASPSVESYFHARSGRYSLLELKNRPGIAALPDVRVIDMRSQGARGEISYVSIDLKKGVERRLDRGEQVILFLNRRGYAPMLKCAECGQVPLCPQCRLRLTYHKIGKRLTCHYCGYVRQNYDACEKCGGTKLLFLGTGTQKVEETLPALFEKAHAVRLDSDSASGRKNAHVILSEVAQHKYNLLLGTQMVTKGLDLPDVSLVGVLSADMGIDLPDFRSSEKTFARLLQVAGRSGRADKPGEVLIQTYSPESPVIIDAARQDYVSFFNQEIKSREAAQYPPFVRLINFILSGHEEHAVEKAAEDFRRNLTVRTQASHLAIQLLGPAPCPLYLIRHQFRRHIILKTKQIVRLVKLLTEWERGEPRFGLSSKLKLIIDVDPDDMM